ncbi:MAG: ribosomal maturation YjgA family protein [Planctomycetota bacterium]|jgi:hypothetical protein
MLNAETDGGSRRRWLYLLFALLTIACGLLSRSGWIPLPAFLVTYAGDTLWALAVYWGGCLLAPRWRPKRVLFASLLFAFAIELSQCYHTPWLDALRETWIGGLILGYGFLTSDLVCYTVGALLGLGIDNRIYRPGPA